MTIDGNKIRKLRHEAGLSVDQLAHSNCSKAMLIQIESGLARPGRDLASRLATTLSMKLGREITAKELMCNE